LCAAIIQEDLLEERGEEGGNIRLCSLVGGNDLAHLGKLLLQSNNVALCPDVVGNDLLEERGEDGGKIGLCILVCGNDLVHLGKLLLQSGNVALRPDVVGNESLLPEKIQSLLLLLLPPALRHTISPFLSFGFGFDDNWGLLGSFREAPWVRFSYCVPCSLPEWIVGGGRGSVFYSR